MVAEAEALAHIDLQKGWPTPRLLPSQPLLAAAEATLSDPKRATEAMLYGPNIGDPALRRECAEWLSRLYRSRSPPAGSVDDKPVPISPERICITAGASGNLACIMAAFSDPAYTRRVWMVEPTYFLACTVFDDAGFQGRLVGVPEDDGGLDVEHLRRMIEAVDLEEETTTGTPAIYKRPPQYPKLFRHVIYLVPTFSNPSSKTYPLERREALVRLAREKDALLVTDDCYDFLSWSVETRGETGRLSNGTSETGLTPTPPPRLVDVDSSLPGGDLVWGNAVSNGSFSKVVGPGMRCGWAEATPTFIWSYIIGRRSGTVLFDSYRARSSDWSSRGTYSDVLVPLYQHRSTILRQAVEEFLGPLGVKIDTGSSYKLVGNGKTGEVHGGFFLYILFPVGIRSNDVADVALKEYNLRFLSSGMMAVRGSKTTSDLLSRGARLCWAWQEEEQLVEGVQRIARVLKDRF